MWFHVNICCKRAVACLYQEEGISEIMFCHQTGGPLSGGGGGGPITGIVRYLKMGKFVYAVLHSSTPSPLKTNTFLNWTRRACPERVQVRGSSLYSWMNECCLWGNPLVITGVANEKLSESFSNVRLHSNRGLGQFRSPTRTSLYGNTSATFQS